MNSGQRGKPEADVSPSRSSFCTIIITHNYWDECVFLVHRVNKNLEAVVLLLPALDTAYPTYCALLVPAKSRPRLRNTKISASTAYRITAAAPRATNIDNND